MLVKKILWPEILKQFWAIEYKLQSANADLPWAIKLAMSHKRKGRGHVQETADALPEKRRR